MCNLCDINCETGINVNTGNISELNATFLSNVETDLFSQVCFLCAFPPQQLSCAARSHRQDAEGKQLTPPGRLGMMEQQPSPPFDHFRLSSLSLPILPSSLSLFLSTSSVKEAPPPRRLDQLRMPTRTDTRSVICPANRIEV